MKKNFQHVIATIKNPYKVLLKLYKIYGLEKINDKRYLDVYYAAAFGFRMNFDNPITYNQKIQWLKLYNRNPEYTKMVDKYKAKLIAGKTIGEEYIVRTYGVYSKFSEIEFDSLPNRFVLKCTHDSGSYIICKDKSTFDILYAKNKLESRLDKNPFWDNREWPYKNVVPRIICEEFLENDNNTEIMDYKFMCFNGEPKCIFVCSNRLGEELYVDFFDLQWSHLPFERHYHCNPSQIAPPYNLKIMIELARKLSRGIPHVRIDFYEVNNKVYFGEYTFYPGSGVEEFIPYKYDEIIGEWLKLPDKIL